jgi:signal transduction histidine kinase
MSLAVTRSVWRDVGVRLVNFWHWLPKGTKLPEATWRARHRFMLGVVWVQVPLLVVVALRANIDPSHVAAEIGLVLFLALFVSVPSSHDAKAVLVSLALVSCSALLIHFTHGLIESHFHFFVVLPLISLYRDWRPLVTGLLFVLLHHSVVGLVSPASVFNHPAAIADPVKWTLLHGAYVLMVTAVILAYWRFSENLEIALATEEKRRMRAEEEKLRADTERLEQVVRSKDKFVASVSHELRTPLSAVLGFAQILRDTEVKLSDTERRELTDTIAREAYDIAGIVEDLLVAARAEIDAVHVNQLPIDLQANVAQVVEVLPDHQKYRITVLTDQPKVRASADPVRVRQIVRNLISNAIRYGGPKVIIDFVDSGNQVSVVVSDNGGGVPPDEHDLIFLPYHSAHAAGSQPASVGLGLSVSRQLAELMNGSLTYGYLPGLSSFELRLPAAR